MAAGAKLGYNINASAIQMANAIFGSGEVLLAAKYLVNGRSITAAVVGGTVDCVHLHFDRHHVLYSAGRSTESYLPCPQTKDSLGTEIVAEACAFFPHIDPETGDEFSPAARRALNGYEARGLLSDGIAA